MATANSTKTDLYALFDYVQNTQIVHPKEVLIETLRNFFEEDSYYHYSRDEFGFPNTPDHTNLPNDAGLNDDVTTRVYIGEYYRYDVRYYPSILVRSAGTTRKPISMSRNKGLVKTTHVRYIDGYGNETIITTPSYYSLSGAWEGTVAIDVETRSLRSRDELVELVSILVDDQSLDDLTHAGVFIKNTRVDAPSEEEDRNDKIFKQSISLDIRTEWNRHIPINSVVDAINICVDFGDVRDHPPEIAPNLRITTALEFIQQLSTL